MEIGLSPPARRAAVLNRATAWKLALGGLVLASVVVRTWAAWLRATPNYFPDESIYAGLSRSLAHGHLPAIRGQVAHFPALLQPLLTAPAWWFGSLEAGYRITQAIEAAAMSTTALVVWWTARRLGVTRGTAFAVAALSVAVPDLGYSGWLLSEPFAYPLFVAAVAAGTVALARPAPRAQAAFLAFALLATFARIQLAVLPLAYLAAALLLRRARAQRLVVCGLALAVVVALAGGLGFYRKAPGAFHLAGPAALGRNALVLAFGVGWIVVPAALLGLVAAFTRARSEEERAFGALALAAGVAVLGEATLYGDAGVAHERYGCYLLPLLALGFALHADRGWPWRRAHALLAGLLLVVSAAVPLSGWAAAGKNAHSLVLTGLLKVESLAGSPGGGALAVAAVAAVLSLVSLACAWRRATALAAALAIGFCIAASAFATSFDVQNSRNVKAAFLPAGPEWVSGEATLVAGPVSPRTSVLEQFFWNRHVDRLLLLPGAQPPDVFAAAATLIERDGRIAGASGRVVLDEDGSALVPREPLKTNGAWLLAGSARLAAELDGRYGDGWLAPAGRLRTFGAGTVSFTVTAPEAMSLRLAGTTIHLATSAPTRIALCGRGTFGYAFSKHGSIGFRAVSARASFPSWTATRERCDSGTKRSTLEPLQPGAAAKADRAPSAPACPCTRNRGARATVTEAAGRPSRSGHHRSRARRLSLAGA